MKLFTQAQLNFVHEHALNCGAQHTGELSVYGAVEFASRQHIILDEKLLGIVYFCAEECRRQESGELSVYHMVTAWNRAFDMVQDKTVIGEAEVLELSALIEPEKNATGYRRADIRFKNYSVIGGEHIPRQMETLLEAAAQLSLAELSAQELYVALEIIHPLRDGNGRLGKILFNVRSGTLTQPVFPQEPDWESLRR